ncbi:MAG: sulfate adenylyltransferase subunit CysD, partial [Candidatus Omnitrophota bacterium]
MKYLNDLENKSIYILREAYANIKNLAMLWSIGKDSTVLLWLTRKAFFGHVPFPLIHIDTAYKIPEMIKYRDKLTKKWKLNMIYGINEKALAVKKTFKSGNVNRIECCENLKTKALEDTLNASGSRYKFNHQTGKYHLDKSKEVFTGIILGIRSDEEGSRSKERYFSVRDKNNQWRVGEQAPEFWDQYNTDLPPKEHVRIHPLLDWTELNIWEYIEREKIPMVSLYYNKGQGLRYRSLGCYPCTFPIK